MTRLFSVVHTPHLYRVNDDGTEREQKHYCASVLRMLDDMTRNCVILVDKDDLGGSQVLRRIFEELKTWPAPFGDRALDVFTLFDSEGSSGDGFPRNRLVRLPPERLSDLLENAHPGCEEALQIAEKFGPDAVITASSCQTCIRLGKTAAAGKQSPKRGWIVGMDTYEESRFAKNRRRDEIMHSPGAWIQQPVGSRASVEEYLAGGGIKPPAVWKKEDFLEKFYRPLVKYAKHIKIVDRWIGRHIVESVQGGKTPHIKTGYREAVESMYRIYLDEMAENERESGTFQVYGGHLARDSEGWAKRKAAQIMRDWGREASVDGRPALHMHMVDERRHLQMPHYRCIITDQFAVRVDPGFDIFLYPEVPTMFLDPLPYPYYVEELLRRLGDFSA